MRTFLVNWALARQADWRIVLRIEDFDGPRVKAAAIEDTVDTLRWLGMDWDEGPLIQSADLDIHVQALRDLASNGLVYPCELSRTEIEAAASAPHADAARRESRFPEELRPAEIPRTVKDLATNWRFVTPRKDVEFCDQFHGPTVIAPWESVGDFVVWSKRGLPSYQLAVVVDDQRQGVTEVVRGDDLIDSAGRQLLLYEALGYAPAPKQTHLPLVVGKDGRRLAKRHGDTRASHYRERGVRPERIIGLLASWCGISERVEMSAGEFSDSFRLATMPRDVVTFNPEDEAWLLR